jgi:hypothetical protein
MIGGLGEICVVRDQEIEKLQASCLDDAKARHVEQAMDSIRAELIRRGLPVPKEQTEQSPPPPPPPSSAYVPYLKPRQWPWYLLQGVVALAMFVLLTESDLTDNPYAGVVLTVGAAWLATVVVSWSISFFRRLMPGLVRKVDQPSDIPRERPPARRQFGYPPETLGRLGTGEQPRNLINPPTKPPAL